PCLGTSRSPRGGPQLAMKFGCVGIVSILFSFQGAAAVSSQRATGAKSSSSPWLSLLTNSWALSGESQPDQTKGLDSLAHDIVQLAKTGAAAPDATMTSAIDSIRSIVTDMKAAVNDSHSAAQAAIDQKANLVTACKAPAATDMTNFQLAMPVNAEAVLTCRESEKPLYDSYTLCESEKARCSNTNECCAALVQPNKYCLNPGIAPSPLQYESTCEGASMCKEADMTSKLAFFKGKLQELDAAEAACETSRAGCQESYDCATKEAAWKTQKLACHDKQTEFEQSYCNLATSVEAQWDSYLRCYDVNKTGLVSEEQKQAAALPGRQQEWRALLRIDCLLSADPGEAVDGYFKEHMYSKVDKALMPEQLTTYFCDVRKWVEVSGLSTSHCSAKTSAMLLLTKAVKRHHGHRHLTFRHTSTTETGQGEEGRREGGKEARRTEVICAISESLRLDGVGHRHPPRVGSFSSPWYHGMDPLPLDRHTRTPAVIAALLKRSDLKELSAAVFVTVLTRQAVLSRQRSRSGVARRYRQRQAEEDGETLDGEALPLQQTATSHEWRSWTAVAFGCALVLIAWPSGAQDSLQGAGSPDLTSVWQKALNSAAKGGAAGLLAGVLQVFSFMWLRTAMNYQYATGGSLKSALSTLWEEGGLRRLYQGVQLALIQAPLSRLGDTAANAGVLVLMEFYYPDSPMPLKTAAASTAASLWRFALSPIDTLKTTYQVRGERGLDLLLARVKKNGPGELYAGAVANFAGNWVGNYPYFVVFNGLDQAWAAPEDPMMRTVRTGLMGMCSSISSDICSNGFRVLKTIRQSSEEVSQREDAAGYLEAAQRVIQRDGLVGLLGRGLETRLLVNVLQGTFFTILWKLIEEKLNQG
ncbi:unnamed protein product, partial [Effrenium voratum]